MSLMLYAIVHGGHRPVHGAGIDGRPLQEVGDDELMAVVSDLESAPGCSDERRLWEYERVVELLMGDRPLLPARFGTLFSDAAAVRTSIRDQREELRRALQLVAGAVELAVRARSPLTPPLEDHGNPGTAYMSAHLDQWRAAQRIARALEPLSALARAVQPRPPREPGVPFAAAYLIDREQMPAFTELLEQIDRRMHDVELVCTGPWPPYSFAKETAA